MIVKKTTEMESFVRYERDIFRARSSTRALIYDPGEDL